MGFPSTRLRRLRQNLGIRRLVTETRVDPSSLVWPLFIVPGKNVREPIRSLPGIFRYSADVAADEVKSAYEDGIGAFLLFGIPEKKDEQGSEATRLDGLIPSAVKTIKNRVPDALLATDVCLCAYTSHGHCGVVNEKGDVLNDASLELLSAMACAHAKAGADIVAPSDMMDGRVKLIRRTLDENGCANTLIMSYAAKYASAFYGPFRDAMHSTPAAGDRKSYQMNPANAREALREISCDIDEGADIVMVKPAGAYLDIIAAARERFDVPIAAYQVSGEYAMIKAAAEKGWLDEKAAMQESLTAIARAGANIIITYFARSLLGA